MMTYRPIARIAAAAGLVLGGLVLSTGTAAAATPTCGTSVIGVSSDGKLVERQLTNARLDTEYQSADPLPFPVNNMVFLDSEKTAEGRVSHINTFTTGSSPRVLDQTRTDASATLTVNTSAVYARTFAARLVAGSGRYYAYGVDRRGNLTRWTRTTDTAGHLWFDSPKLVARHMGGLKTLSYSWSFKTAGTWTDVLYGTTRGGALKQFRISWSRPGAAKVTTVKKSGFAATTGMSLSICDENPKYVSFIAVDQTHNRARWYTLRKSLTPRASNLVNRGLAARGSDWRMHAIF